MAFLMTYMNDTTAKQIIVSSL